MSDVIRMPPRTITGRMTLIAPGCDCLPENGIEFEQRLFWAMALLFHAWDMKIDASKFENEDGQMMAMFNVNITDWSAPDFNELDQLIKDTGKEWPDGELG